MNKIFIVGAGGHGRSVAEAIQLGNDYKIIGFFDDIWPKKTELWGVPIYNNTKQLALYRDLADWVVVAIGNNKIRHELMCKLSADGFKLATIVHPAAMVSPSAILGSGCVVMAGAIIGTESTLGTGVIINAGANVDHHCYVNNYGHLGVNACMAGGSILGEEAWLQAGAAIGYGVQVPAGKVVLPGICVSNTD